MNPNHFNTEQIERAKKQVKRIKGFYTHLLIYILVNLLFVGINLQNLAPGESYFQVHNFITFGSWGIAIIIHALSVFIPNFVFGSKWEERKIKEYIQKENKHQQWS